MFSSVGRFPLLLAFGAAAFSQTPAFGPITSLPAQQATMAIVTADFNGDGVPDLAVANAVTSSVTVFLGAGGGKFSSGTSFRLPVSCQAAYITAGHFTAAAAPDVLVVCALSDIVVLPNNGHGSFGAPLSTTLPSAAWVGNLLLGSIHPAIGDFNGDGFLGHRHPHLRHRSVI